MRTFRKHTLSEYLDALSSKKPAPGGGSAAAVVGALGAGLLSMVARYSQKKELKASAKKRITSVLKKSEKIRKRLLILVDLDAQAYRNLVATRNSSPQKRKAALKKANAVPLEICRLCYDAVGLAPYLVCHGSRYLVSDVEAAVELLNAAFNAAMATIKSNQS